MGESQLFSLNAPHVLESIFLHLELDELGRCRQVSARWRDFLDETEEQVSPFRQHVEALDFRRNLLHIGDVFGESSDEEEGEDEYPEDEDEDEEEENGGFERMSCSFSLFVTNIVTKLHLLWMLLLLLLRWGCLLAKKILLFDEKFIFQPNDEKKLPASKISLFVSQMTKTPDSKKIALPLPNSETNSSGF